MSFFQSSIFNLLDYHYPMVSDRVRTRAYEKAIYEVIKPGDVVLEIGCGTGILSFFAAKAGASKVYSVECSNVIDVAKMISHENNFDDVIEFINLDSRNIELNEKVDIIITETIGSFGLMENILEIICDARDKHLKPGGKIIPRQMELYLLPIGETIHNNYLELFQPWNHLNEYNLKVSALNKYLYHNAKKINLCNKVSATKAMQVKAINFTEYASNKATVSDCYIGTDERLFGFVGWFKAQLSDNIFIDTSTDAEYTHWEQMFFPIEPVAIPKNGKLAIEIQNIPFGNGCFWSWKTDTNGTKQYYSTFISYRDLEM